MLLEYCSCLVWLWFGLCWYCCFVVWWVVVGSDFGGCGWVMVLVVWLWFVLVCLGCFMVLVVD